MTAHHYKFDWPGRIVSHFHPGRPGHDKHDLNHMDRHVLLCLAIHCDNDTLMCNWSTNWIVRWTGLSRAQVKKSVAKLATKGAINVIGSPEDPTAVGHADFKRTTKRLNLEYLGPKLPLPRIKMLSKVAVSEPGAGSTGATVDTIGAGVALLDTSIQSAQESAPESALTIATALEDSVVAIPDISLNPKSEEEDSLLKGVALSEPGMKSPHAFVPYDKVNPTSVEALIANAGAHTSGFKPLQIAIKDWDEMAAT